MVVFSLANTFGVFTQKAAQVDLQRQPLTPSSVGSPESSATTPKTTTFISSVYTWAREHEQVCGFHTHHQPTWPSMEYAQEYYSYRSKTLQMYMERDREIYRCVVIKEFNYCVAMNFITTCAVIKLIITCVAIKISWFIFMQLFSQRFSWSVKLLCADTNGISKPQTTLGWVAQRAR